MKFKILSCPSCGGDLEIENEIDTFFCKYCGYKIVLSEQSDAVINANVKLKEFEHKIGIKKLNNEQKKINLSMIVKKKLKIKSGIS